MQRKVLHRINRKSLLEIIKIFLCQQNHIHVIQAKDDYECLYIKSYNFYLGQLQSNYGQNVLEVIFNSL